MHLPTDVTDYTLPPNATTRTIAKIDDVSFYPDAARFTLTTNDGQAMPLALSSQDLEYLISSLVEFAARLGAVRHPDGPLDPQLHAADGEFLLTKATGLGLWAETKYPDDLVLGVRVHEIDVAFRMDYETIAALAVMVERGSLTPLPGQLNS